MIVVEFDLMDGLGKIEVVVADRIAQVRLQDFSIDADNAFVDAGRWEKVRELMTNEHSGPNVGWTLGMVLPGNDPDDAIDSYEVAK